MTMMEKMKWIVLPALILIGIGVLEINFPHVMDNCDDGYTGRGVAGLIVLLFELFLCLTWGKLEGAIAILLGITAIVICLLPKKEQTETDLVKSLESEDSKSLNNKLALFALHSGKNYVRRKLQNP